MRGAERQRERGPTVQIKPAHNDSYLHTFRLHGHLHIQKYSAIFPCLPSARVCMCTIGEGLRACGGNVSERRRRRTTRRGGDNSLCVCVCQSACVTCVTQLRSGGRGTARRDERAAAPCSDMAEFVFDYCTRLRSWQRKGSGLNNRDEEFCLLKLSALLFIPSKYLITTHLYGYPQPSGGTFLSLSFFFF